MKRILLTVLTAFLLSPSAHAETSKQTELRDLLKKPVSRIVIVQNFHDAQREMCTEKMEQYIAEKRNHILTKEFCSCMAEMPFPEDEDFIRMAGDKEFAGKVIGSAMKSQKQVCQKRLGNK